MSANPLAVRVAERHRAAVQNQESKPATVVPTFTRRITADDLSRVVERQVGQLLKVRFRDAMDDGFGVVDWEGINDAGDYVIGKLRHLGSGRAKAEVGLRGAT